MPFQLFRNFIKSEGYCCPWLFLKERRRWFTSILAQDSGMQERKIREWRQRYRRKELKCEKCSNCKLLKET